MSGNKPARWMCTWCGRTMTSVTGRPYPGECPRKGKTRDGRPKPHTWVKK